MSDLWMWLSVFVAVFVSDLAWVLCIRRVQNTEALKAGFWAVVIFIPVGYATVSFVENKWLLIPAGLGHFLGTYTTVLWEKRHGKKQG